MRKERKRTFISLLLSLKSVTAITKQSRELISQRIYVLATKKRRRRRRREEKKREYIMSHFFD